MTRYPFLPDYVHEAMGTFRRLQERSDMLANIASVYKPAMGVDTALSRQISGIMGKPATDLVQQQYQMLDSLNGNSKSLTDQILGATRLGSAIHDQLRIMIRPTVLEEAFGLVDRLEIQQRSISEAFTGALAGIGPYQEIETVFGTVRQPAIQREVEKMLDLVRGMGSVSFDTIAKTLSIGGDTFEINDFGVTLEDAATEAEVASESARLKVFLQIALTHAGQLKGNRAAAFTLIVLLWLTKTITEGHIQTISGAILRPVTDAIIRKLKPDLRKQVVAVQNGTPLVDVRSLRLVAATNLQVRVAPRRNNSRIVTRVSTPTVVVTIREVKDWTLVQYRDGDVVVRGWVFSRYLAKLDT
jgi:hypothetical protein